MRFVSTLKWIGASLVALALAVLAFIYGKETVAVAQAKVREREAKLRKAKLDLEAAQHAAQRAKNEVRKRNLIAKADTLQVQMIEIEKDRTQITQEFAKENGLSNAEYAKRFNRRYRRYRAHSES